jgi:undecaprenyl pyrophosphate synthase
MPKHIGVMVDGNRRWAKQFNAPTSQIQKNFGIVSSIT